MGDLRACRQGCFSMKTTLFSVLFILKSVVYRNYVNVIELWGYGTPTFRL